MIKRIGLLVVVALVAAMMLVATAAPAFAVPFNDRTCEGTYENNQGTKTCVEQGKTPPGFKETDTRRGPTITDGECRNRGGGTPSENSPNCP